MTSYSEKLAIVLDVGARYVKCGIAEDRAPRCVLRWEVAELLAKRASALEWREYLSIQLRRVCYETLRVNPRHRRFLVSEDMVVPHAFRNALAAIIFTELKAASMSFVPTLITTMYATAHHTALVVDCGWAETRVLPIYKGIPMQYLHTAVPLGTVSCCRVLRDAMQSSLRDASSSAVAEDLWERACFAHPYQNPIMDAVDARFGASGADDQEIVVPGHLRGDACEVLFEGSNDSGVSIVSCIVNVVMKLPIDVRAAMVENMLIVGGTAMIPGFCSRLVNEVRAELTERQQRYGEQANSVTPHFPRNVLAWIGASIYASTESARDSIISLNEYEAKGDVCLPDWMSIAPPMSELTTETEIMY